MADLKQLWSDYVTLTLVAGCLIIGVAPSQSGLAQVTPQHVSGPSYGQQDEGVYPRIVNSTQLANLIQVHPKVLSGGQPQGELAFDELKRLGVRTIISVDGASPDLEMARRFELRYVHLPHGYDGISEARSMELAKAVIELDGLIYIHCHHGKHRSPAAASVACVLAGLLPPEQSARVLELAGTNPNYRGLFRAVRQATPFDPARLESKQVDFREVAEITPIATAMLALETTLDQLLRHRDSRAGESQLPSRPGAAAVRDVHENATLLREHFTELIRLDEVSKQPPDYQQWLRESEAAAASLTQSLDGQNASHEFTDAQRELLKRITENCSACHEVYRDTPAP